MRAFGHGILALCLLLSEVTAYALGDSRKIEKRETKNDTDPAPVVASVSQFWEGNDGPWSSFTVLVGNKSQEVRVLPSTASTTTWVVYEEGCPEDAPSNCPASRGKLFNPNNSLTWVPHSIFELGLEDNLGFNVFGDFGFDSVAVGWQGSNGPTVEHSVVAGIGDTTLSWLGVLGLNPRPTNFTTITNAPQVSFVQSLKDQNDIPSVSWAYTAGAPYRLNKVFGSLIFGGYDNSRFKVPEKTSPDLTFPFYTDISRDLLVGISSIETSSSISSNSSSKLLEDGIFALIDSTVPHLWLPRSVCKEFEFAFGMTWNSTSELYTLSSTHHATLKKLNPSITITLSPSLPLTSSDQSVAIVLPYSAFDLNVSWPYADESTYYFPLKRAADETQFTLGRTFLQEAYLIADYERYNFSVWPCSWDSDTNTANIVTIRSINDTSDAPTEARNPGNSHKSGLSTGVVAGIAVGGAALAISLLILLYIYLRKRRPHMLPSVSITLNRRNRHIRTPSSDSSSASSASLHAQKLFPKNANELDSHGNAKHELASHQKFGLLEAPSESKKFEMDAKQTPLEAENTQMSGGVYEMDVGAAVWPRIVVEPPSAVERDEWENSIMQTPECMRARSVRTPVPVYIPPRVNEEVEWSRDEKGGWGGDEKVGW